MELKRSLCLWLKGSWAREGIRMHSYCKKTSGSADIHCEICGQGFVILWELRTAKEREHARKAVQQVLRSQHRRQGHNAHPEEGFSAPEWNGALWGKFPMPSGPVPAWEL